MATRKTGKGGETRNPLGGMGGISASWREGKFLSDPPPGCTLFLALHAVTADKEELHVCQKLIKSWKAAARKRQPGSIQISLMFGLAEEERNIL
jgi:hypothetical protein